MATTPKSRDPRAKNCNGSMWKPEHGSQLPSHKLQCFSVACHDMPDLEFGDKIVLPPKVLLELQCLKIPTPLLFKIRAGTIDGQASNDEFDQQYCSVQEFSAPEGQVFLPYWLMQNLRVPEGGSVEVSSVVNLPLGIYCRFQPETTSFLDLAASIGPKLLMETALRRYSVLSENSTIVIEHGSVRYYVRVAELKPASVVSLCGDVDLETDFMPPEGFDPKRPSSGKLSTQPEVTTIQSGDEGLDENAINGVSRPDVLNESSVGSGFGRRLKDGGYVERNHTVTSSAANSSASRKIHVSALQQAQRNIRNQQNKSVSTAGIATTVALNSPVLASQLRMAQGPFSTPGNVLGTTERPPLSIMEPEGRNTGNTPLSEVEILQVQADPCPSVTVHKCALCLADISSSNADLHTLRCAKNPSYHKFECSICHEKTLRVQQHQHLHCPDCEVVCKSQEALEKHQQEDHSVSCRCPNCGALFTRSELQDHVNNYRCDHTLLPCKLCGLSFTKEGFTQHSRMCSSRTERCDFCKSYIKITEFDEHSAQCEELLMSEHLPPTSYINSTTNTASQVPTTTSNQDLIECVYCVQTGFANIADLESHVTKDCRIAKAFASFANNNQQEEEEREEKRGEPEQDKAEDQPIVSYSLPVLAQGRMRRKGDTTALSRSTAPEQQNMIQDKRLPISSSLGKYPTQTLPGIITATTRSTRPSQAVGKHRTHKPKPSPQLRPLPPQVQNQRVEIEISRISSGRTKCQSGGASLSISSAGGTSQSVRPPPLRSRTISRSKKQPISARPPFQ